MDARDMTANDLLRAVREIEKMDDSDIRYLRDELTEAARRIGELQKRIREAA